MIYDAIVLGVGGVGSAALYHLARSGARVLGIDRFPPGHLYGSSHGRTRIIRLAYFEHPDYVPLLQRAYALWEELEATSRVRLYWETGLLEMGPRDGTVISGVLRSAEQHGLEIDTFSAAEIQQRFPGFQVPSDWVGALERRAGVLRVEDCVRTFVELAERAGADLKIGAAVQGWRIDRGMITVFTEQEVPRARNLIITAGPWAGDVLAELGIPFSVRRKSQFWYQTAGTDYRAEAGTPAFLFETPVGIFYGFPQFDELGVKIAEHTGGQVIADPLRVEQVVAAEDRQAIERFFRQHLPQVTSRCLYHEVCLYTMSPDEHFVLGQHPRHQQVCFAAGLSGHGFKFVPVLGEALAHLVLAGKTSLPVGFLSPERFRDDQIGQVSRRRS